MKEAREGDIVILAGKGHETYQVLKDKTIAFDDREVAREVLKGYGYHKDPVNHDPEFASRLRAPCAPQAHPPPWQVAGWSVDTRTQKPGDVYFALRGPEPRRA